MAYSRQTTTGRNTVVRKQGMLQIRDLHPKSMGRLMHQAQRALVFLSVVITVGIATGGTARPIDARQQAASVNAQRRLAAQNALQAHRSAQPTPAVAVASTELMHDIAEEKSITPLSIQRQQPRLRTIVMEVTAYCSCKKCCGPNAIGITASGKDISYNDGKFVAADTSVLPFGTRLQIPGYNAQPVEVIDRGGAIKGNKLDVFFASHEEALRWGRQMIAVTVVD
jgi:3D (Asp-Asp-Asp) domain-containing protein